ncbi:hypothetical protein JDV02_002793 [Purpureocillium takamizusanense]|uniref:Aldehyde dehydrogenase domain-containing protein n=1 Tax=Purpureocillium takamizusanense TaxID=2060973 RepID=A0A9Q8QCM8_9HYPO|nr:uncharacterized protein JDV02_002793 [Purpureocillium takamizusanense]UNI16357.1 hypothetical protein JDV02_002793 [Purpureocillium takamizusanense]
MSISLEHAGKQVVPLWCNGENCTIRPDNLFEVVHAADGTVAHYAQSATVADAQAAVEAARDAFPAWSTTSIPARRAILLKVADLLTERADELGVMQARETSSAPPFGSYLAKVASANIREVASQITTACTGSLPPDDDNQGTTIMVTKQAIGPVLIISPWNSPTVLGPRSVAAALAAGCTVVLKASELCPQTYRMLCQVFADAGLPRGVLNQVVVRREDAAAVTESIVSLPAVRKVEFIGSAAVGSQVAQTCAQHLKPILLELGGKAPAIVCGDANLAKAAAACAFGAFAHHGQICMSTERIIVVEAVAEEFCKLLKKEVDSEKWSRGGGSAATTAFADKAHALLEEALRDGAEYFVGDNTYLNKARTSLRPTIVTKLARGSRLRDLESFGPSATLYVVRDEDEALEVANDSSYGLSGAIWTSDIIKGIALSKRLECGMVHINAGTMADFPTMAIQGVKGSGWGSNNSVYGIEEFLITKSVTLQG